MPIVEGAGEPKVLNIVKNTRSEDGLPIKNHIKDFKQSSKG